MKKCFQKNFKKFSRNVSRYSYTILEMKLILIQKLKSSFSSRIKNYDWQDLNLHDMTTN
jgi:hypothetical protein